MKILLTLLLLLPFTTWAQCFPELPSLNNGNWCVLCWVAPTEREDNTPLALTELSDYIIEVKDVDGAWINYNADLINTTTGVYWYSGSTCPACTDIRIAAVDIDSRQSIWAYPACPPVQPSLCQ